MIFARFCELQALTEGLQATPGALRPLGKSQKIKIWLILVLQKPETEIQIRDLDLQ
jgi:hypothetical protein